MPRLAERPVLYRVEAEVIAITALAAEGLLRRGQTAAGFLPLRNGRTGAVSGFAPISIACGQREGMLVLHEPERRAYNLGARELCDGLRPPGVHWTMICTCGTPCRCLYRRQGSLEEPWGCRKCTKLRHPDARELRRFERRAEQAFLQDIHRLRDEIDRILESPARKPRRRSPPPSPVDPMGQALAAMAREQAITGRSEEVIAVYYGTQPPPTPRPKSRAVPAVVAGAFLGLPEGAVAALGGGGHLGLLAEVRKLINQHTRSLRDGTTR